MGNESNPLTYSMAIFNCVVVAILTFFFPLGVGSKLWTSLVIGLLVLLCNILYLKREELAADENRSFNGTFALILSYVVVVITSALPVVVVAGKNASTVLGLEGKDADALAHFANAYVYFTAFALHMQNSALGLLAEEQGRRAGFVTIISLVCALACFGMYYVNYFEVLGEGVTLPNWSQSLAFLLLLPSLLRLRQLESYGHI